MTEHEEIAGPKPIRLYQQIADRIQERIARGEFHVGERLPAERELAQALGVSRASVREAIIALEVADLVEVRLGSGTYVRATAKAAAVKPQPLIDGSEPGVYEVLETRRLVEGETAYRAALNIKPAQLEAIGASIETMRADAANVRGRHEVLSDREFHMQIAAASGNSVLAAVAQELWDTRGGWMWTRWVERNRTLRSHQNRVTEHQVIFEHLSNGRADAARAAMQHHIDEVIQRFLNT